MERLLKRSLRTFSESDPLTNTDISLTPDGDGVNKAVTESNKLEYIQLLTHYLLVTRTQQYMNEIVAGFRDVYGDAFTRTITLPQLRSVLCEQSIIDVESLIQCVFLFSFSLLISFVHTIIPILPITVSTYIYMSYHLSRPLYLMNASVND